jgi:hypothetical protein
MDSKRRIVVESRIEHARWNEERPNGTFTKGASSADNLVNTPLMDFLERTSS